MGRDMTLSLSLKRAFIFVPNGIMRLIAWRAWRQGDRWASEWDVMGSVVVVDSRWYYRHMLTFNW
jgi:hypothetical protein